MSWEVKKQRLLYSDSSGEYYPEASDIFALISGSYEPSSALPSDIYSPANDLELRFSKISGSIVIRIWMKENDFQIGILIKKGNIKFDYLFEEDDLPDSIVIENAWYSLLTNAVETKDFLRKNDVHQSGRISLSQYIKIISSAEKIPELEIIDDVTEKLSNHERHHQYV